MAGFLLWLSILACGTPAEEWQMRGWTVTPSPEDSTSTPVTPTQTPFILVVSATPEPTKTEVQLCITAQEAVYLRPSPNASYYPIDPLSKGTRVSLTGARDGDWVFVNVDSKSGWIHSDYVGSC